ncbi:MAG: single-stranded DNA-binding protein [Saprospiraceae bacterium]|nr:single-stranded DNA-binding protein [Saprospiraceae bacterium]MBK8668916.1 single-stranded DNA-binding protein [Saprospiraceae bacterium]MBL0101984.1 single-stranded DNA-binding protein [Saprospiraceae bacterium]
MNNNIKNTVQLVGNAGRDVKIDAYANGNKKASLVLATNEYYTNKKGEKVKQTEWHKIIAWGKTAEEMAASIKKGSEISVHGKLSNRTYTDTTGVVRSVTEVVVNEFYMLSKKAEIQPEAVPF